MKKVGIVTINANSNFGNKLQNFALTKILENYDLNVTTIWHVSNTFLIKEKIKSLFYFVKKFKRQKMFINYNKKYLNIKYVKEISQKTNDLFDYFVVGSDQVWNYNFSDDYYLLFLKFAPKNKNISYAASFGVDLIPDNLTNTYFDGLSNIGYISVREDKGKEIAEKITNRKDIEVLIDPTMLLTSEEWDKTIKKPNRIKNEEKYILNYFLGELSNDKKMAIEKIAKENNCKIINILDKKDPFYVSGPSEFLWLEKNAFLICTDSFHSSVFAILYNRPFIVFDREDNLVKMNSRIETLISKLKLENRRYNGRNITEKNLNHNYDEAYKILEEERRKSENFLKRALKIEE